MREVIGLDIGEVESGAFWLEFLRGLKQRGLAGCAAGDLRSARRAQAGDRPHDELPVAALHSPLHRDMVMHCRRDQRNLVAAALSEVFNAEDQRTRAGGSRT